MADFTFFDDSEDEAPRDCWASLMADPSRATARAALSAIPPVAPPDPDLITAPARDQLWALVVTDPDKWLSRLIALPHGSALCQTLIGTPAGLPASFRRLSLPS